MRGYYERAIIEVLEKLTENQLCFIYSLMVNLGWKEGK